MKNFRNNLQNGEYNNHLLFIICIIIFSGSIAFGQTKAEIKREIIKQGIKKPLIVTKQCFYETGHLKSHISKINHNMFGMKKAKVRRTTAKGTRYDHAYFISWKQSILDYKIWQMRYFHGGDYYTFLNNIGYATSKKYVETLKQIKI